MNVPYVLSVALYIDNKYIDFFCSSTIEESRIIRRY